MALVDASLLAEGSEPGDAALLRASTCDACGRTEFPAAGATCPNCAGPSREIALGPAAHLVNFTEVLHRPPGAEVDVPYTIAVAGFGASNVAVLGVLDHHVPSAELEIGQPLEVCVVATRTAATFGFRLS